MTTRMGKRMACIGRVFWVYRSWFLLPREVGLRFRAWGAHWTCFYTIQHIRAGDWPRRLCCLEPGFTAFTNYRDLKKASASAKAPFLVFWNDWRKSGLEERTRRRICIAFIRSSSGGSFRIFIESAFNTLVGRQPHERNKDENPARNPMTKKSGRNGDNIQHGRYLPLQVFADSLS